ncbi:MAG: 23S rRNA (pseudouridine(1915)-N(3))-methyltransferase RlmH [Gammaproteobacteria bacterium]
MHIRLLAVGRRPPPWAEDAVAEYAKRLAPAFRFAAPLLPLASGHGTDSARALNEEGERLLAALARDETVIALNERGAAWTTAELAARLADWQMASRDVALLVGGPDGLASACLERADAHWSLSPLTLPHALVRVIVVEQLYRAASINAGHPYHRA